MTSIIKEDDKILTMYRQYKTLINKETVWRSGTEQIAAQLTIAHMLDHVVCLLKNEDEEPVKVRKLN